MLRINEIYVVLISGALASGCQAQEEGEGTPGTLEVRIRGISPEVDALKLLAGGYEDRVALSAPSAWLDVVVPELSPGPTAVEVYAMRGTSTLQTMHFDVIVRGGITSVLSVDLGFHSEVGVLDAGTVPGPADAADAGGAVARDVGVGDGGTGDRDAGDGDAGRRRVESDPIVIVYDGLRDFSVSTSGLLRAVTAGDPNGAYQTFLERAAPILSVPASSVMGVSSLELQFVGDDDVSFRDVYTELSVLLEGPLTGTLTLASHRVSGDASGWLRLSPPLDMSSALDDLLTGEFNVSIQGQSPLEAPEFEGQIRIRTVYHAQTR